MYRIDARPTAAAALAKVPGLRPRVEEALCAVLESALELRSMSGGPTFFSLHEGEYMRLRVANYMISYTLQLDEKAATVVMVERIRTPDSGDSQVA